MRDAGHSAKLSDQVQGLAAATDVVDVVVVRNKMANGAAIHGATSTSIGAATAVMY